MAYHVMVVMSLGFVVIRHVCNEITDSYWKESYRCIRKWYPDAPILMIDDSSNREFLKEDIVLTKCTVIYDTRHKGCAELLPYYYFHLLHPFDTAVIIHDSVFIQQKIDFTLETGEPFRFLWGFPRGYEDDIYDTIMALFSSLPKANEYKNLYTTASAWYGCFGVMTVIQWEFLHNIDCTEQLFEKWLPIVISRSCRSALERAIAVLFIQHYSSMRLPFFGNIFEYLTWGITFEEYKTHDYSAYPIMKVWSSR